MARLWGDVTAKLSATCSAVIHGDTAKITGGHQVKVPRQSVEDWCDYYGVTITKGVVVLYKAVRSDFSASRGGVSYQPGTTPAAPDWDGGKEECGGGLHFSPSPGMALEFFGEAKRFVACPIKLSEIVVHWNGDYPQKVKAAGCCGPVYEVTRHGDRIG